MDNTGQDRDLAFEEGFEKVRAAVFRASEPSPRGIGGLYPDGRYEPCRAVADGGYGGGGPALPRIRTDGYRSGFVRYPGRTRRGNADSQGKPSARMTSL